MSERRELGFIVGGSLKGNLSTRLTIPAQQVQEGSFVIVNSGIWRFFGLVTDLQLGSTDQRFADEIGSQSLRPSISKLLHGETLYTNLELYTSLMLEVGPDYENDISLAEAYSKWAEENLEKARSPIPVKTVPNHHSKVFSASSGDVAEIFGTEDKPENFEIGYTRDDSRHPVRINLDKFVERSSGIFGATGTGKSFTTLMVLAGLIKRDQVSLLVFDMHNEYGFSIENKNTGERIKGLREGFKSKVQIIILGTSNYRNVPADINLEIAMEDILPEDIELLYRELNLRDTTSTTLSALYRTFGKNWFSEFLSLESKPKEEDGKFPSGSLEEWCESTDTHPMAAKALQGRLRNRIESKPYIVKNTVSRSIDTIIDSLIKGKHVILSFGKFNADLDYLLVSNILTRKIRAFWEEKVTESEINESAKPRPLVIVVEEAHKLLNKEMAAQTTFNTIAREFRKYNVTLLIVDQRPSQIYDEVLSQLGTRVSGWLGDEDDVRAVLSGLPGKDTLRGMLARLESGKDILLLGPWGIPMPLPVNSRRFNHEFWEQLLGKKKSKEDNLKDIGF